MADRRPRSFLSGIVDIQPGEKAVALLLFLYFFFITAPYYIIKSLRNASFLDRLTDARLPLAYFLTAVLMGLIVNLHSRLQVRLPRRNLIVGSLAFFLATMFVFWWLLRYPWEWVPVAFWVWANIFAIVLVTQFWILVNDTFNPREAKRLIGFIGSGAQLGAILGGVLAGLLARGSGSGLLLPLAAGMLGLGIASVFEIFRRQKQRAASPAAQPEQKAAHGPSAGGRKFGFRDAFKTTRTDAFLRLLAGIMVVTWVVSTLIDYQFNSVVSRRIEGAPNLTSFFGFFNAGAMAVAFLLQLLLTSRIIKSWGIRVTLLIYPLALLFFSGGTGLIAYASILPAILLKASDKSLAYSLNQSVRELLYIPISPDQKYQAKIFIDMFLNRFAKGLGAVILMGLLLAFPREAALRFISVAVVLCIALWVLLNLRAGRQYGSIVKDKLEQYERGERLVAQQVDIDTTKLVFDTLESRDRSDVLYSMNLFDLIKKHKLTPDVRRLIDRRSGEIRTASLGTVFELEETGLGPSLEEGWDDDALKQEVQEIMELEAYQEVMKEHIGQTLRRDGPEGEVERMEAAKTIGFMSPRAPAVKWLDDLIQDDSLEVSRLAIRSAGELKRRQNIPALVQAMKRSALREDAADSLEKYGAKVSGTVADYLHDPGEPEEVRRTAARVLSRLGTQEAADFLALELAPAGGALEPDIIDALDMIRAGNPKVCFPTEIARARVLDQARAGCRRLVEVLEKCGPAGAGSAADRQKDDERLRMIFQLLGLIYPYDDIAKAFQNFRSGTKNSVAYAVELLDTLLDKELRDVVLPLVEDLPDEERLRLCRSRAELSKDRNPE